MAFRAAQLLSLLSPAAAWGPDGHTIVGHIAESLLTQEANASLFEVLGNSTLTQATDWNDNFDHTPEGKWSEPLHFINYPGQNCSFDWERDCVKDWCNAGALVNYTKQIYDKTLSPAARKMAAEFVLHMMGDLHQPLHVASADDEGGNLIKVGGNQFAPDPAHWSNHSATLHSQWDSSIVEQAIYDLDNSTLAAAKKPPFVPSYHKWSLLTDDLEKRMAGEWSDKVKDWANEVGNPMDEASFRAGLGAVASDTASLGCKYAYVKPDGSRVKAGDVLDHAYYVAAKPAAVEQLAKGGIRLAQVLNAAFAASKTQELIVV